MLKSYIRIAWRNIMKNRFYSAVNVIGLSAGIAFALLVIAFIWSELQVNTQLRNASSQYIIQSKWKDPSQGLELTTIGPLAKSLKEQYPHLVANYYRWDGISSTISHKEKSFREGIQICDSTLFQMYGFKLLYGDAKTAFEDPFSVVLTKDKALKYFGRPDVVGQTLTIESFSGSKHDFIITAVMEKPNKNSVTFITEDNDNQFYTSIGNINFFGRNADSWQNPYIVSYLELKDGVDPKVVEKCMLRLLKLNAPPEVANNLQPYLTSLKDYHIKANNGLVQKLLSALSAIAFFILLMAVVNFINMAVSRSAGRMREIGIRKVLGSLKKQLIVQFLIESILFVLIATIFALVIYSLAKEGFGNILGSNLPGLNNFPIQYILYLILLILVLGSIAGAYPAFFLSSLKSVESLKGKMTSVKENILLRKSLIAFQFATATVVFIGAMIISQQIGLFFSKDLGYNKESIISLSVPRNWTSEGVQQMKYARSKLAGLPQVKNVSLSYEVPNGNNSGVFALYRFGGNPMTAVQTQSIITDEYFASTYEIPMAAGEFYGPPGGVTDSSKLVINEKMAHALGWKNLSDAIGQRVMNQGGDRIFTIAGVTRDFHFETMQQQIQPLTFYNVTAFTAFRVLSVKLQPGNIAGSIEALRKQWPLLLPGAPFEYTFMDDTLKMLYRTEIQLQQASYIATTLSFIIVLLGVVGLIAQSVQKRSKEIGIRKVLGSSVKGIVALFMKEILWTVLLAGSLACPFAYFLLNKWLGNYAYRIHVSPTPFILAILVLGLFTAIVVVTQTIRTALISPANSLKAE